MLAITHHIIVKTCLNMFKNSVNEELQTYGIIGDDVAILGKSESEHYINIMDSILDVPINPIKGFTSKTLTGDNRLDKSIDNKVLEIAKHVIINGEELTPGSPKLLSAFLDDSESITTLLNDLHDRGILDHNDLEKAYAIAELGISPKSAKEYFTFPVMPARFLELGSCETLLRESNIIWYSNPELTLDQIIRKYEILCNKQILTTLESIISDIVNNDDNIYMEQSSKDISVFNRNYRIIMRSVNRIIINQIDRLKVGEVTHKLSDQTQLTNLLKRLESISSIEDLISYKDDLNSKYRNQLNLYKDLVKYCKSESSFVTIDRFPETEFIINNALVLEKTDNVESYKKVHLSPLIIDIQYTGQESCGE